MTELFIEYIDTYGDRKRELVTGERCVIGRHSECDIVIADSRLSRRHLIMDRYGDVFVASDAGSSNGTLINGISLKDQIAVKNGDVLDLGGFTLNVAFGPEEFENEQTTAPAPEVSEPTVSEPSVPPSPQPASTAGSGSLLLWILVPVFGLIFIMFAGLVVFLIASGSSATSVKKQNDPAYSDDDFDSDDTKKSSNTKESGNSGTVTTSGNSGSNVVTSGNTPSGSNTTSTTNLSATAKIEQNGGAFLRRIAQNDPRAFLTTEQATKLNSKIKQFSGSSAVSDNLNSARKNAAQIKSLAESKNIKPQMLAIAAIAKLGSNRGDVLQTAQGMTETIDKLATQLGNELADDSLLVIAAYGQGAAGDTMKMRNMLQDLANKSPDSSRAIRTIWFLQKNGKISQAEFENALNFLAIGTISQNPKDFGVNAEALIL